MGRTARKRPLKNQKALKNIPINHEEVYERLKSWMIANKWKAVCNLKPYVFEITGRGLMTLDKVEKDQVVLQIPKSLLITTFVVSQSPIGTLFSLDRSYSAQCVLATFLIYEKHLNEASCWKPYLDTLPSTYTNPEFCSKVEKRLLPEFIGNKLSEIGKELKSSYFSLIQSIKKLSNNTCDHCKQSYFKIFSYHSYIWAYYTINTRAIYMNNKKHKFINIKGDDNLALAPFLDLFNHTCETVADAQLISFSNGKEFYQIRALRSYDQKMQIFINYGAHSSLKLYLEYGFFISQNPLDQIFFHLSNIQECHQVNTSVCNFLKTNKFDQCMAFTIDGLNYNAKNALFIITSNLLKESLWKKKIYHEELTNTDLQLVNNLGLTILQNIKMEFIVLLSFMIKIVNKTESFKIAISLIKEYIEIIENSLSNMRLLSNN